MKKNLEDVLEEYAVETPAGNDQKVLIKCMAEYPQFAEDLMDFASMRAIANHLSEPEIPDEDLRRYREAGLKSLHGFLDRRENRIPVIASLTALAKKLGLDKQAFAKAAGLSISLIMYLEKRRFQAASVPGKVIRRTARVLKITEEAVAEYVRGPQAAGSLSYKAEDRPEEVQQKHFADAVREDQTLSEDEKRDLLE